MKKTDVKESKTSKEFKERLDVKGSLKSKSIKSSCYASCMNDSWDLKGESECELACRV